MMTRALMTCHAVEDEKYKEAKRGEHVRLEAYASGGDDDPNKSWSEATPSGRVEMFISNPGAWGKFEQGKNYYVDFRLAE